MYDEAQFELTQMENAAMQEFIENTTHEGGDDD